MQKLFLAPLLALFSPNAAPGDWKFRAREHYEIHNISVGTQNLDYSGFSNTINFWYEKPFDYSLGIALGPLFISSKISDSSSNILLGNSLKLYSVNVEYKRFLVKGLFVRPALGWSILDSNGNIESSSGINLYAGAGYEFLIHKVGLAFELAVRQSYLSNDIRVSSFTPSIGIHFYNF